MWPKFFKNMFQVVHAYYRFFSSSTHIVIENLLSSYFYYSSFAPIFLNRNFSEFLFLATDRKINKIY